MDFPQSTRVGMAAALGLAIVMPVLYFTESREVASAEPLAIEQTVEQTAATAVPELPLPSPAVPPAPKILRYFEVLAGCTHSFVGACVNIRSRPCTQDPAV